MGLIDLRKIFTGVKLSQSERLEAELRHARARNEARAKQMAQRMGSRYLLAKDYSGHYVPELTPKAAA
jgi:hypothetical protein